MKINKAQAILEYSLLVAVFVGAVIVAGSYVKRGLQGQAQQAGDQVASQYAGSLTYSDEQFESKQTVIELTTPGIGAPNNIILRRGSQGSDNERELLPLSESLSFYE